MRQIKKDEHHSWKPKKQRMSCCCPPKPTIEGDCVGFEKFTSFEKKIFFIAFKDLPLYV